MVLRVSRTAAPVPATASTQWRVSVATPDRWPTRLSAVRSAVSSARVGPVDGEHRPARLGGGAVVGVQRDLDRRPTDQVEDRGRDRDPGQHARRPGDDVAGGRRVLGDGRERS